MNSGPSRDAHPWVINRKSVEIVEYICNVSSLEGDMNKPISHLSEGDLEDMKVMLRNNNAHLTFQWLNHMISKIKRALKGGQNMLKGLVLIL